MADSKFLTTESKTKSIYKEWSSKSIDLIAAIDSHLDKDACLRVRKELLEEAIAIFESQPSEERDHKATNWKNKVEYHMTTILRQNAEYLSTIDSAPLV